jgi:uncharacterized Fe-S cluster-containing radical SAM superfamily protein
MYNWNQQDAISFEVARETIGHMIAIKTNQKHMLITNGVFDGVEFKNLENEIVFLANERSSLEVTDTVAFERIRKNYGQEIKNKYAKNV